MVIWFGRTSPNGPVPDRHRSAPAEIVRAMRSEMDWRWIARPPAPHDFGRVVAEVAEHDDGGVAPRATGD